MTFSALKHLLTWYFSTKTVFLYFYGQAAQTNKNYFLRHFDSFTPHMLFFLINTILHLFLKVLRWDIKKKKAFYKNHWSL